MDRELWKQVDALLEQAMDQPPEEREAFVLAAAHDNPVLRDEVLSLLKAQSQAAGFMERSALNVAAHALGHDSKLTTIVSTLVGQKLESYQIEKLLGAGGMGEVYLARDLKLDFGLVKLAEVEPAPGSAAQTQLGVAMGTLAYMSPEQA
jgi:hypothetical protein